MSDEDPGDECETNIDSKVSPPGSYHGSACDDDDEQSELETDRYWPPPTTNIVERIASEASKTISALAFNHSATRFATGSHQYELRIWDFERPNRIASSQPCRQSVIKNVDYSKNDELILVISASSQAVVIGKDGTMPRQCPKGDQYIKDMAHTKGHVQMLNDGRWSPKDKNSFITSSNDGTIRLWDVERLAQQLAVVKIRSPVSGLKAIPNVCGYNRDALSIATGCNDGSLMMWDTRKKFVTTSACIKNAHLKGSEITGIDFSYNLTKVCTRSADESCKVWDLRKLKDPLATQVRLETMHSNTDCSFSPNDQLIITGTSGSAKDNAGRLVFLDADNLAVKETIEVADGAVVRAKWEPKINHIGYTCSNGKLMIRFDERRSMGGFTVTNIGGRGTKRKLWGD